MAIAMFLWATLLSTAYADGVPRHLELAEFVVDNILPENNIGETNPNYLLVPGYHDVEVVKSRNICATLQTNLIKLAYEVDRDMMREWTGSISPYAFTYHDLIVAQNGFRHLRDIREVRAGDYLFFVFQRDPDAGYTGHSMLIAGDPVGRNGRGQYCFHTIEASPGAGIYRGQQCLRVRNYLIQNGELEQAVGRLTRFQE